MIDGFDAIFWDCDGTLVDSEPVYERAFEIVAARHGARFGWTEFLALLGNSDTHIERWIECHSGLSLPAAQWKTELQAEFRAHITDARPRAGVPALLGDLGARGMPQAVVSNGWRSNVLATLRTHGLDGHFAQITTADDVPAVKPDPAPYRLAAEGMGVRPGHCLAIEDSPVGARSAAAAGMTVIAWPQFSGLDFDGIAHRIHDHGRPLAELLLAAAA